MSLYSEFAPWYEQLFPFREEVYLFLREHAGTSGSRILDTGCGPGHYCDRFQRDGFPATLYLLSADSFLQLHSEAGFALAAIYAGFDTTPFNRDRDSGLVMVFMKEQGSSA